MFLTPGQPPQLFREGEFLARLPVELTAEHTSSYVDALVPYGLRDRIGSRGVAFDFNFGPLYSVHTIVSKAGDSYRLRLRFRKLKPDDSGERA
ncbi:MAG: hypothetical protein AMK72_03970 [Planctomycetes bacterium SM23_25]|nr:MAG: hypothetical protein AMK72_03970 [Planctomycetes bacterium SM23_25]